MSKPANHRSACRLKQLYTHRAVLTRRVAQMAADTQRDQTGYLQACEELAALNAKLDDRQRQGVVMTEHAILRYLERVLGLDLDKICNEVLTPQLQAQIEQLGDGKYPIGDGYRVRVKDKTIVTVLVG